MQLPDPQNTIDLLLTSFELIQGKTDDQTWLHKFSLATNSETAICARWTRGHPEKLITSDYGTYTLPIGWTNWAEHICNLAAPTEIMLLDDMLTSIKRPELNKANPIRDPQTLIALVDWSPTYMFMIAHRDLSLGQWTTEERAHFKEICLITRKSIKLHKAFARTESISNATIDILNSSPRGVIAFTTDGDIQFANTLATKILGANDGICSRDGKLVISSKKDSQKINEFINTTSILRQDQLHVQNDEATMNISISRPSKLPAYQLLFSSVGLTNWTIESSPSDRMVLVYLYDPSKRLQPSIEQMIDLHGLTKAQARVAVHICSVPNIPDAAKDLGISINTARSHLRAIYEKTKTKNQSELASLLTATLKTYNSKPQN